MKSFCLLALCVFVLLFSPTLSLAGPLLPCPSCAPTMDVFVNFNYIGTIVGVSNDGGATFLMAGTFSNPGQYLITINTSTDPDPIVDYDLGASNFSSASTLFSFSLSFDTVGGPYDNTESRYEMTVSDLGSDGASALPGSGEQTPEIAAFRMAPEPPLGGSFFISNVLGNEPIGNLGAPCFAQVGSTNTCSDSFAASHNQTDGLFQSTVTFQLGPTDRAEFRSTTVVGEIPEPSAAWLLGGGLVAFAGLRWRARRSRV